MDAKLVAKRGNTVEYHISCAACHRALMLKVGTTGGRLSCSGVLTDCSFEDALLFKDCKKINVDDVLAAHLALQLDNFIEIR